jgi:hypothetical protein
LLAAVGFAAAFFAATFRAGAFFTVFRATTEQSVR